MIFKKGKESTNVWYKIIIKTIVITKLSTSKGYYHNVSNVVSNGSIVFSNIAFQGSTKSLVKVMLVNKYQRFGVKNNIMFGKLIEIGTGFVGKKTTPIL